MGRRQELSLVPEDVCHREPAMWGCKGADKKWYSCKEKQGDYLLDILLFTENILATEHLMKSSSLRAGSHSKGKATGSWHWKRLPAHYSPSPFPVLLLFMKYSWRNQRSSIDKHDVLSDTTPHCLICRCVLVRYMYPTAFLKCPLRCPIDLSTPAQQWIPDFFLPPHD